MRCLRCQGLSIAVLMTDMGQPPVVGWHCLLCGATTDPGIEANQAMHTPRIQSRARLPGASVAKPGKGRVS
jgi:hypothetical protein